MIGEFLGSQVNVVKNFPSHYRIGVKTICDAVQMGDLAFADAVQAMQRLEEGMIAGLSPRVHWRDAVNQEIIDMQGLEAFTCAAIALLLSRGKENYSVLQGVVGFVRTAKDVHRLFKPLIHLT